MEPTMSSVIHRFSSFEIGSIQQQTNPGTDSLTPTLLQLTQYWLGLYFILSDTLDVNVNYDGLVIP